METIKVFWVDDEHEKFTSFKNLAKDKNILITARDNAQDATIEIQKNIQNYDAVILDANFKEYQDSPVENRKGTFAIRLQKVIRKITTEIPIFVLSGKIFDESWKGDPQNFNESFERTYDKGELDDIERLIEDIIKEYEKKPDVIIRKNYKSPFMACFKIGKHSDELLLGLLKEFKEDRDISIDNIRIIMENSFDYFQIKKIVPSEINGAEISRYLCSKPAFVSKKEKEMHYNYKIKGKIRLPRQIATIVQPLWFISNGALHNADDTEMQYFNDDPIKWWGEKHTRKGLVLFLCDYLNYVNLFFEEKPSGIDSWEKKLFYTKT